MIIVPFLLLELEQEMIKFPLFPMNYQKVITLSVLEVEAEGEFSSYQEVLELYSTPLMVYFSRFRQRMWYLFPEHQFFVLFEQAFEAQLDLEFIQDLSESEFGSFIHFSDPNLEFIQVLVYFLYKVVPSIQIRLYSIIYVL